MEAVGRSVLIRTQGQNVKRLRIKGPEGGVGGAWSRGSCLLDLKLDRDKVRHSEEEKTDMAWWRSPKLL